MDTKNIFKMEIYKNFHDRPYVIMVIILASVSALLSIIGASIAEVPGGFMGPSEVQMAFYSTYLLAVALTFMALAIFSLLYPFHLLNVDYKNKVMSLMVASGVSRLKYYFVKIAATLLSCFVVTIIISFIPLVVLFIVMQDAFVRFFVEFIHDAFTAGNIIQLLFSGILNIIQFVVVMVAAVIITKGKFVGIFVFIGFNIGISMIHGMIRFSILVGTFDTAHTSFFFHEAIGMVLTVITIGLFGLLGALTINKQDL